MKRRRCDEHPDVLYEYGDGCYKCEAKRLSRKITELETVLAMMTEGDKVAVHIGYPFDRILGPLLSALGYRALGHWETMSTPSKHLFVGRRSHDSWIHIMPEGLAKAIEPVLKDIARAISEEAHSTVRVASDELAKKALERIENFFDAKEAKEEASKRIASMLKLEMEWKDG